MVGWVTEGLYHLLGRANHNISSVIISPIEDDDLRDNIQGFSCLEGEPIHDTWLRFKKLVLHCPTHGLPDNVLL